MWEDREFLKVAIPRAMLDPNFGQLLRQVGPLQRGRAIGARLKRFRESRELSDVEFDALVQSVTRYRIHVRIYAARCVATRPKSFRQDRHDRRQTSGPRPFLRAANEPTGFAIGALPQLIPHSLQYFL